MISINVRNGIRAFSFGLSILAASAVSAQEFSGGFKAGLNLSTIQGPSERSNGQDLEANELSNGFHIGARANLKFSDLLGVRAELLYTQRGSEYKYSGPSYWTFVTGGSDVLYRSGNREQVLDIKLSYLELPLMAFVRLGKLEVGAGVSASLLLRATGTGQIKYNNDKVSFLTTTSFNYNKDAFTAFEASTNQNLSIDGRGVKAPQTAPAYYEYSGIAEKKYNTLDYGVTGSISYFWNSNLYLGVRVIKGLSDITNVNQDISKLSLDAQRRFTLLDDNDTNLSFEGSVGFSF